MGNLSVTRAVAAIKEDSAIAYHATMAREWHSRYRKQSFRSRVLVLKECLDTIELRDTVWLDAGCGSGVLSRWLAQRGAFVHGMDAAAEMVNAAAEVSGRDIGGSGPTFATIETIADMPLNPGSVDGVLCSSVLEYVDDPAKCIAEFARVLKPNGLLIASVPNRQSLFRKAQIAIHACGTALGTNWMEFLDYSRHQYRAAQFIDLLGSHGFDTQQVIPFGSPLPRMLQRLRFAGSLLMFMARKAA